MDEAFKLMQEKDMLVQDKGAYLCDLEKYKLGKVVIKKAGELGPIRDSLNKGTMALIPRDDLASDGQTEPRSTSPVISAVPHSDSKSTTLTR